jgi:TRAP-type C4-dicarboxylate transport system permease small subunit
LKWLDEHFEQAILVMLLSMIVLIMLLQVIMRYVFNNSLSWPEELSRILFVWFTFIGLSYSTAKKTHVKIDLLVNIFPAGLKNVILLLVDLLILGFFVVIGVKGITALGKLVASGQATAALGIPIQYIMSALEVGIILSVVRLIQNIIRDLISYKNKPSTLPDKNRGNV